MWKWIILGALFFFVAIFVYFVGSLVAIYRGMFTVKHHREVAAAVERIRREAMERPWVEEMEFDELAKPGGDPRTVITSRSLAVSYTITQEEAHFEHHVAVSTPKAGHTTHAAGEAFVSFIVWRSGLDPQDCVSFVGPSSYHLVFTIPENEQAAFMERSLRLADEIDLQTIREEIQGVRDRIDFVEATELMEEAGSRLESTESKN